MFGYVTANQPELSTAEFQRYHACYCGLCRELGRHYGRLSRVMLSYDMVFLIMLLSSLYEPAETPGTARCIIHPVQRHEYWNSRLTTYAADMTVLLMYYSCLDAWQDDRNAASWCAAQWLRKNIKKIEGQYPRQYAAVEANLARLNQLEKSGLPDIDAAAGSFGAIIGELAVYQEDHWSARLRRLGAALGGFVYVMDAYEDVTRDTARQHYNVLTKLHGAPDFRQQVHSMLTLFIGECAAEFEELPLVQDAGIMRNILYSGVWGRFEKTRKPGAVKEQAV